MKRNCLYFVMLALGVCILGCSGGGDFSSPKSTFETMVKAAKADDKEAMMACFTEETRADMEELERLSKEMEGKGPSQQPEITDQFKGEEPVYGKENITGDQATLEVTMQGKKESIKFIKEGGEWRVSMPEIKMALQMMKNMPDMMKNMMKGMTEGMEEGMDESMIESLEETMKEIEGEDLKPVPAEEEK